MQSLDDCGREIKPGQGIEINNRFTVCSKDCEKEFRKGKLLRVRG
jgi:ribosomal protein L24E